MLLESKYSPRNGTMRQRHGDLKESILRLKESHLLAHWSWEWGPKIRISKQFPRTVTAAGRGPHIVSLLSRIDRTGISLRSREEVIAFTGQGILVLLTFRVRVANMVGIAWSKWGLIQEEMLCIYGMGLGGNKKNGCWEDSLVSSPERISRSQPFPSLVLSSGRCTI